MGKVQLSRGRVVGGQNAQDLAPAMIRDQNYKHVYEKFAARFSVHDEDGDGSPTGTAGHENMLLAESAHFEWHVIGTQTILFPSFDATKGLNLMQDATTGDGSELALGIGSNSRGAFTVGTDNMYFKVNMDLTDVSEISEMAVGFRKLEAYNGTIDAYNDMAAFNIQAGVINIETILDNAGTTTVDTTETDWADNGVHTMEVRVDRNGKCDFFYDGARPAAYPGDGTNAAFTFDDAEVVMPFVHYVLGNTAANGVFLKYWDSGLGAGSTI